MFAQNLAHNTDMEIKQVSNIANTFKAGNIDKEKGRKYNNQCLSSNSISCEERVYKDKSLLHSKYGGANLLFSLENWWQPRRSIKKDNPWFFSPSRSFKYALRGNGCRISYEPTKNELISLSAVDIQGHQRGGSALSPHQERQALVVGR